MVQRPKEFRIPAAEESLKTIQAGEWLLCSKYSQAHKVSRNGSDAVCGRPCDPELHAWVIPGDEYAKCARCKGRDYA